MIQSYAFPAKKIKNGNKNFGNYEIYPYLCTVKKIGTIPERWVSG